MKLDSKLDDQAACWQRKYNQGKSQGSSVLTKHQEMRHSWFGCELWEAACPPLATAGTTPRETEELRSWLNAKTLQGMACLLCWLMPCKHYRDPKERRMVRDHCVPQIKPAVVTQKRVTVSLQHSSSGNSLSLLLQAFNTWPLWEPTCLLDMKKSGWSMFHTCETKWRLLPTAFLPIILSEAFVVTVSTHISPSPCGAWLFHGNQRPVPYSHQHPGVLGGAGGPSNHRFAQPQQIQSCLLVSTMWWAEWRQRLTHHIPVPLEMQILRLLLSQSHMQTHPNRSQDCKPFLHRLYRTALFSPFAFILFLQSLLPFNH